MSQSTENKPTRHPVDYRYDALNHDFIKLLAKIASYAAGKYGSAEQYATARLEGEKSPINHIYEHLRAYQAGEEHDHFEDPVYHLAAIAYNCMMEALYLKKFGPVKQVVNLKDNPLQLKVDSLQNQSNVPYPYSIVFNKYGLTSGYTDIKDLITDAGSHE